MKQYLIRSYTYSHWANELLAEAIVKNQITDPYIHKMLSHVINAAYIWMSRIDPTFQHSYELWQVHDLKYLMEMNNEISEKYINFISKQNLRTFDEKIENQNQRGEVFQTALADILIHIANHSAHHRGQIARKFRESGVEPPNFNYITYARSFNIW